VSERKPKKAEDKPADEAVDDAEETPVDEEPIGTFAIAETEEKGPSEEPAEPVKEPAPKGKSTIVEQEPEEEEEEDTPEPEKPGPNETKIVYHGVADTFEHGGRIYRPDQPVIVPSDVAEDLLTYPNEQFEKVTEE